MTSKQKIRQSVIFNNFVAGECMASMVYMTSGACRRGTKGVQNYIQTATFKKKSWLGILIQIKS